MLNAIPDIYKISETVNNIQKNFMEDVSEDTLNMSTFGYQNAIYSDIIQNSIVVASEWGNEAFPIRTKFEKNILTNAITYDVKNINAIPAQMKIMIGFIQSDIEKFFVKDTFRILKDCDIKIGKFNFKLDYDILMTKSDIGSQVTYSARYDIQRKNLLSDIKNPYLPPPLLLKINNDDFVFLTCTVRQVEELDIQKKIVSNNILENKTFDFKFNDQLASFDIKVIEGNKETYLTPIFEGMPLNGKEKYCFYSYLDKRTIRVRFAKESYQPKLNCVVDITLYNTLGEEGNFIYKDDIIITLSSDKFNYRGLNALIKPVTDSANGINRKSMQEIKETTPKEILSRGNIINNKDLENFFNDLNNNNRLFFYRRRDNQLERLYYAYMLVKDMNNNVIPTNTIDMRIREEDFDTVYENRCALAPGNTIKFLPGGLGKVVRQGDAELALKDDKAFVYSSPFNMIVNKDPLSVSYYLNEINRKYDFNFTYINSNSSLQYISTSLQCYKNYISGDNYKIRISAVQNMNVDKHLVDTDSEGNIIDSKIKPALVINTGMYNYYVYGKIVKFDASTFTYEIEFELETDNLINKNNQIRINNVYIGGSDTLSHVFVKSKVKMSVYMFTQFLDSYGVGNAAEIFPNLDGYTLCNIYESSTLVDLFYNYSAVIKSKVKVYPGEDNKPVYKIEGVPLVKYSYLNDEERCNNVIDYIQYRKIYIDNALNILEDGFSVDLKYFNTYGPSRMFNIGYKGESLDKVNLTLKFKIKLYTGADKNTKQKIINEIKTYVENINNINEIHMTNLTTDISNKFKNDILFIEFDGINNYGPSYQYISKHEIDIIEAVPEFLNIDLSNDLQPNIQVVDV